MLLLRTCTSANRLLVDNSLLPNKQNRGCKLYEAFSHRTLVARKHLGSGFLNRSPQTLQPIFALHCEFAKNYLTKSFLRLAQWNCSYKVVWHTYPVFYQVMHSFMCWVRKDSNRNWGPRESPKFKNKIIMSWTDVADNRYQAEICW